jgi:two-component system, OmpR family, phosphate regulon response regulator PhoB
MEQTIYLAEDDEDIRDVVEYLLGQQGFKVAGYSSARVLQQKMILALPDLIILDIMLPDANGIHICRKLKSDPATQHIPVLLMSANINNKLRVAESGADDFINKPFDIDDLINRVRKHITGNISSKSTII